MKLNFEISGFTAAQKLAAAKQLGYTDEAIVEQTAEITHKHYQSFESNDDYLAALIKDGTVPKGAEYIGSQVEAINIKDGDDGKVTVTYSRSEKVADSSVDAFFDAHFKKHYAQALILPAAVAAQVANRDAEIKTIESEKEAEAKQAESVLIEAITIGTTAS